MEEEERQMDRQMKFQTDGRTESQKRKSEGQTDRQKRQWADKISKRWKNRQTEKKDRGTDR